MINPSTSDNNHLRHQRVIINADDLGFSQHVNQAIEKALVHGWIRSATLMANGPCCNEGVALAHRHRSTAGFGIHLNLTEFQPLSDPSALATNGLLNKEGSFSGSIRALKGDRELMAACFRELDMQILKLRSMGVEITHIDSHHHVHTIPWMLPVIRRLQKKHGIWRMRTTMNVYGRTLHSTPPLTRILAKKAWTATCRLRGSRMPQVFTGLDVFLEDPRRKDFQRAGSIELMCHPGQEGYGEDLPLLERCQNIMKAGPYRLCSFKDI